MKSKIQIYIKKKSTWLGICEFMKWNTTPRLFRTVFLLQFYSVWNNSNFQSLSTFHVSSNHKDTQGRFFCSRSPTTLTAGLTPWMCCGLFWQMFCSVLGSLSADLFPSLELWLVSQHPAADTGRLIHIQSKWNVDAAAGKLPQLNFHQLFKYRPGTCTAAIPTTSESQHNLPHRHKTAVFYSQDEIIRWKFKTIKSIGSKIFSYLSPLPLQLIMRRLLSCCWTQKKTLAWISCSFHHVA